jgi:nucleotide-binding universal stress UspA family protein
MFHRILVAVDDSPAARKALERALELVEAGHGRLGLLSSAPGPPPLPAGPAVVPVSRRQLEQDSLRWAQRNVAEAERLVPSDVPVTKLVTRGAPGPALLRETECNCWDLVVVGQTRRRFRWPFREPLGEWLGRRTDAAVLVVHDEPDAPRSEESHPELAPRPASGQRAPVPAA